MLAQVTLHSRGVYVWSLLVLAVAYLQRGVGDVTKTWVTWLSPLGWAEKAAPFGRCRGGPWSSPGRRPQLIRLVRRLRARPAAPVPDRPVPRRLGLPAPNVYMVRACSCVGCTVAAAGHRHRAVACPSRFPRCAGSPDRIRPFDLEEAPFLANAQH
jgi:hypothetical protein